MSNDVTINVRSDTSGVNFSAVDHARDSLGRFTKQTEHAGRANDSFRDSTGRLRDAMGRFVSAGQTATDAAMGVGQGMGALAGQAGSAAGALGQVSAAGGPVGQVVGAVAQVLLIATAATAGAAAAFTALAPALLTVAGAAAAAAGALVGLGSAYGALKIGFGGIGDALAAHGKASGGGGGGGGRSSADTAEQEHQAVMRIRNATRALVDAKRAEREAIADVNRAREREIERLKDLDAAIRGGAISEKEAALELEEARLAVQNMDAGSSREDQLRMRNRLERAQVEYDETVRRNKGLAEERKKADRVGVDGSDQVKQALQRQAQAHEQVTRAQEGLAEANRKVATSAGAGGAAGGVNAFNEAMKKLSPNAQALVRTLIDLSARWDAIKKRVQDRLLEGAAAEVRDLAGKWLPVLESTLGRMADRLNVLGRGLAKTLGSKDFIDNFKKASEVGGEFITRVGGGIAPLVDGFMRLAANSGPVLQVIGRTLRDIVEWFNRWLKRAEDSGQLQSFMERAAQMLDKIVTVGKLAFQVVGEFISIIFPSSENTANSVFNSITEQLQTMRKWLQDPENRAAIKRIADAFGAFISWVVSTAIPFIVDLVTVTVQGAFKIAKYWNQLKTAFEVLILALRKNWNLFILFMTNAMIGFVNMLDDTLGRIVPGLSGKLGEARKKLGKFKDDTNKTLAQIKDRAVTIKITQVFEVVGQTVASVANQLVNLGAVKKGKAHGGIGGAASGGARSGLTWVGEHGPELAELSPGARVYSNPDSMRMAGQAAAQSAGSGGHLTGTLRLAVDRTAERGVINELFRMFRAEIGTNYGGSVELALGRPR